MLRILAEERVLPRLTLAATVEPMQAAPRVSLRRYEYGLPLNPPRIHALPARIARPVKVFDSQTARVIATVMLFIAAGAFVYGARDVLIAFVFAILFAYLLEPWVSSMQRWRRVSRGNRLAATLQVYGVILLGLGISIAIFGSDMVGEARNLVTNLPVLVHSVTSGKIAGELGATHGWSERTQEELANFLREHSTEVMAWVESIGTQIAQALPNLFWIVLVPILAFFLLKDARELESYFLERIGPTGQRGFAANVLEDLNKMMAQYIRVQLIMAAMALAFYMGMLSLMRVPYSLVLGAVAGLLEFLPTIGPALGAAAILGVAFLAGYHHVLIVALLLGAWRVMQDYGTFPRLTGARLRLHPLAAIFAILVGFELGGIVGAYLSIPIIAAARIVGTRWERRDANRSSAV